jgi:hypothetical protein
MSTTVVLSIGEQTPWRLTKPSSFALLEAICKTRAQVISSGIDHTSPPTHVMLRVRMEADLDVKFRLLLAPYDTGVTRVEPAGGAA